MAQPVPSDVHVDVALSNIAIGYSNENYIADQLFPVVPVPKQTDKYFIWTKDFWFRNHVAVRAPGAAYPEGGVEISSTSFECIQYALSYPIARELIANADAAVQMQVTGAEWIADQFMLNRELTLAAKAFITGVWGTSTALTGADQWDDYAGSDPLAAIDTAKQTIKKNIGRQPNTLVLGAEVYDKLVWHPLLTDKYKYTQAGILGTGHLASLFDIPRILKGDAIKNTSAEGAAYSGSYIWGKNALLAYVAPAPGLRVPSGGYSFMWDGAPNSAGLTVPIKSVPDDLRNRDVLQGDNYFDQKIVATDCGYWYGDAVS